MASGIFTGLAVNASPFSMPISAELAHQPALICSVALLEKQGIIIRQLNRTLRNYSLAEKSTNRPSVSRQQRRVQQVRSLLVGLNNLNLILKRVCDLEAFRQRVMNAKPVADGEFRAIIAGCMDLLGMDKACIANELSVSHPTVERWKQGRNSAHPAMRKPVYKWVLRQIDAKLAGIANYRSRIRCD